MKFSALLLFCYICTSSASLGVMSLPKARDVKWESNNFKTILTWSPKPVNHTYTVEFNRLGEDTHRTPHCIRTLNTECDLTNSLTDVRGTYTADVVSEPLSHSNYAELPSTRSKRFCPYTDTRIGRPDFTLNLTENKTVVIRIQDQLTALHQNGKHLTIRDVFKSDLKYKIIYSKAGSTGRKEMIVDEDDDGEVMMTGLDEGQSYCFSLAVYIPSRKGLKKLNRWSLYQCSPAGGSSIIQEYGLWLLVSVVVLLVSLLVSLTVICCRRAHRTKEEVITNL